MISVAFPAGSNATKLTFPDQPQLRGAKIHGVEMVFSDNDINGVTNNNYASIGAFSAVSNMYLTLYFNGKEGVQNIPCLELAHMSVAANAGYVFPSNNNGILGFNGQIITWTKSYFTLATATPPLANCVFVLGVYYSL